MRRAVLLITLLGLVTAACAAPAKAEPRFVAVSMTDDMRFVPDTITVAVGETIALEVTNDGQLTHEFIVGDAAVQEAHAIEMAEIAADPSAVTGGGHGHDAEDGGVTVLPGTTAVREYTFDAPATLLIGCHEPGHYEAGMVGTIVVQ
jgi:uncharacterized cupredoxin-like copper-binding protein